MKRQLDLKAFSITTFIAGLVSYLLCIVGDLLFGWTMYEVWAPLMPGFTWPLTLQGFLIGVVWLVLYSIYLAVLIVVPYNQIAQRASANS